MNGAVPSPPVDKPPRLWTLGDPAIPTLPHPVIPAKACHSARRTRELESADAPPAERRNRVQGAPGALETRRLSNALPFLVLDGPRMRPMLTSAAATVLAIAVRRSLTS